MEQKHNNELMDLAKHMDEVAELFEHVLAMQKRLAAYCHVLAGGGEDTPQTAPQQEAALEVPDDWDYIHGTHPMPSQDRVN